MTEDTTPEAAKLEIIRCIRLIHATEAWLDSCPLRKADAFYETAAFPLEELRRYVHENALYVNDEALLKCLDEYENNTDFEFETHDFWEKLAKEFAERHSLEA